MGPYRLLPYSPLDKLIFIRATERDTFLEGEGGTEPAQKAESLCEGGEVGFWFEEVDVLEEEDLEGEGRCLWVFSCIGLHL